MMGFTPADVRGMTYREFALAFDGFSQLHGGGKPRDEITLDEYRKVLAEEHAAGRVLH